MHHDHPYNHRRHHLCHHRHHYCRHQAVYDLLFEVCAIFMYSLPHLSTTYTVQIHIIIVFVQFGDYLFDDNGGGDD